MIRLITIVAWVCAVSCEKGQDLPNIGTLVGNGENQDNDDDDNNNDKIIDTNRVSSVEISSPEEVAANCASGTIKSEVMTIDFAARNVCSFGTAPNIAEKDDHLTAREEQEHLIAIPNGTTICGMKLFGEGDLLFGDALFLTLENHILFATSGDLLSKLEKANDAYIWDFSKIVGLRFNTVNSPSYCGGEGCTFPNKDVKAPYKVDIDVGFIANLGSILSAKDHMSLKLISTGDNNSVDCHHSGLTFKVTIDTVSSQK